MVLQKFLLQLCGWICGQAEKETSVLLVLSEETTSCLVYFCPGKDSSGTCKYSMKEKKILAVIVHFI